MKEEQPCDVYRYLIKQLYTNNKEYIKLLEYIQSERRDDRRETEGLRKELEVSKVNIDKIDKYCNETRKKTINKEVIISIIKGVKV
jgi:thioredoxin-related protein